jgi:hypothetical protein
MATEKRLKGYDPITLESFTRHMTKHREPYDQYDMGYVDAVEQIENFLEYNTVDAVPVVRCKDCKYWWYEYDNVGLCVTDVPDIDGVQRLAFDFCSYGERKTDG